MRTPKYKLRENHRKKTPDGEVLIPAGAILEPIQEQIHYQRGTHKVQVRYRDVIAWIPRSKLGVTR